MTQQPNIVLNLPTPFPVRVIGGRGISISKVNGVWIISLANITSGVAQLDFGAFPGGSDASLAVIGQNAILANSVVSAQISLLGTADHSADEHLVNPPRVYAGNIVPGVGFTIYGINDDQWNNFPDPVNGGLGEGRPITSLGNSLTYGKWSVAWSWQ